MTDSNATPQQPASSRPIALRAWQRRVVPDILARAEGSYLLEAAPGAGKTIPALTVARELREQGKIDRVLVVAPTRHIARQWAVEGARMGFRLEPNWEGIALPADVDGITLTYQRLARWSTLYRYHAGVPSLVVADEPHHMGLEAAWGQAFEAAFEGVELRLLLSGTPFRSDSQAIPGVTYDADARSVPDFRYGYGEAVRDGVCRKVAFVPFDGDLSWSSDGNVIRATFEDALDAREASRRHRTVLSPALEAGIARMLADADAKLEEVREGDVGAGGLVIACDIAHAHQLAGRLQEITAEAVTVVTSDDQDATSKIDEFKGGRGRWLVAVGMVSEGVDVPRLRVGVYATTAKTELLFRQVVGRFVRLRPQDQRGLSYVFMPADPGLRALAKRIEEEIAHVLEQRVDPATGTAAADSPEESASDFVALAAKVEARGALMGGLILAGTEQAEAVEMLARQLAIDPAEVVRRVIGQDTPVIPPLAAESEFERRGRLRAERKRLVGKLGHESGREYAEIQTWVNEATADGKPVGEQTVAELEAGLRLLAFAVGGGVGGAEQAAA